MFKSLRLYRIAPSWAADLAAAEGHLERAPFVECGPTQTESMGWVAPRGKAHSALIEVVDGHWLMRLMTDQKIVPSSVIGRRVEVLAAEFERQSGHKPGRKMTKELKEQALMDLLPMAFTKQAAFSVWIDPATRLLAIDGATETRADDIISWLVSALPGFSVSLLNTIESPAAVMSAWLLDGEPPAEFSIDRDCELKSADETKSAVRYARHELDTDDVRDHLMHGKRPTQLALTWNSRVSFVLTDALQVKKIDMLDVVFLGQSDRVDDGSFDADAAIATGELSQLIAALVDALGGERILEAAE